MKLKDALMLFLFGAEKTDPPSFNYRELKVIKLIPKESPITFKDLEKIVREQGKIKIARRTLFKMLEKFIGVDVVEKHGHGYVKKTGPIKPTVSLNPITRYEGIFFVLGLVFIIVAYGLADTPLGVAGMLTIFIARIVRFL